MTSSRVANCTPILTSTDAPSSVACVSDLLVAERETTDASPCQASDQLGSTVLVDLALGVQPVAGAHLAHAHQRDREQPRLLRRQAGVLMDHLGDLLGARGEHAVDLLPHGGLVGQVGL